MAKVLFAGLESGPSGRLSGLLNAARHEIRHANDRPSAQQLFGADIVFAGGNRPQWLGLLRRIKTLDPNIPVVIAARLPETSDWLDALEAGATDYCAMPFEAAHIERIMESTLTRARVAAA